MYTILQNNNNNNNNNDNNNNNNNNNKAVDYKGTAEPYVLDNL